MKKILNFGSLNLDKVYRVSQFVRGGETIEAFEYKEHAGGKGLNQSIALAKSGAKVYHAGAAGEDGNLLLETLKEAGVNTKFVTKSTTATGQAIIQVDNEGQNCIIVCGGANKQIDSAHIQKTLAFFDKGDYLLLQNEINNITEIMLLAHSKGMRIVFNPSPITEDLFQYPLDLVDIFILNEIEGNRLTNETSEEKTVQVMAEKYSEAEIILTLGEQGSIYRKGDLEYRQTAFKTKVVDTTAAGDTFTGYYLSAIIQGKEAEEALKIASIAAAIAVSREGASNSIPTMEEINAKCIISKIN